MGMPATLPTSADTAPPTAPSATTAGSADPPAGSGPDTGFATVLDRHQAPDTRSAGDSRHDPVRVTHEPVPHPGRARHPRPTTATGGGDPAPADPADPTARPTSTTPVPSVAAPGSSGAGAASDRTPVDGTVSAAGGVDTVDTVATASTPATPADSATSTAQSTSTTQAAPISGSPSGPADPAPVADPSTSPTVPPGPGTPSVTALASTAATGTVPGNRDAGPAVTPTTILATAAPDLRPLSSALGGDPLPRLPAFPADHLAAQVPGISLPSEAPLVTSSPSVPSPGSGAGPDLEALATSFTRTLAPGDGDYSVSVSMHPPELGEVRALLSLRGDILQVVLTPHQEIGHDALATALPALREQLASGGLHVDVSLGQPDTGQGEDRGPATGPTTDAELEDAAPRPPADGTTTAIGPDARIHLVL